MCFVNSPRHDLQEERIRAVYGQIRMKIFCDLVFCQVDDLRRAGEQDLVHGFRDMGWEILHMYDRHLIDPCLQFTVLVRVQPGDQIVRRVGQDIHSGIFPGYIEDRFCGVVGKRLFIDDLAGPAVGDPSSVEGQDITAEFVLQGAGRLLSGVRLPERLSCPAFVYRSVRRVWRRRFLCWNL